MQYSRRLPFSTSAHCSALAEMGDCFARIEMGWKDGGAVVPLSGGAGSPSNTMWPGPRPTSMPSFISIHPTVWPQYINVRDRTDRQDRQRSDGLGRTILQMVAQKPTWQMADARTLENDVVMGDAVIQQ